MEQQFCTDCSMTLEEETVIFGGMLLTYQLLICNSSTDRFRLRIRSGEERSEVALGSRVELALRLYRTVVRGRVTPCGLPDVISELSRCP